MSYNIPQQSGILWLGFTFDEYCIILYLYKYSIMQNYYYYFVIALAAQRLKLERYSEEEKFCLKQ
jgi:hypothetical protein